MICPNETYECANCFHRGPLDRHGRCTTCLSEAVFPSTLAPGAYYESEWDAKVAAFAWRCVYCGNVLSRDHRSAEHELTKDHVIPIARGGVDYLWNIVPACLRCNRMKKNQTAAEFIAARPGLCKAAANREKNQQVTLSFVEQLTHNHAFTVQNAETLNHRRRLLREQAIALLAKRPPSSAHNRAESRSA